MIADRKSSQYLLLTAVFVLPSLLFFQNCSPNSGSGTSFNLSSTGTSPTPSTSPTPGASPSPTPDYKSVVLGDHPQSYWRLGEKSGVSFTDLGSLNDTATGIGTFTLGVTGGITNDSDTAVTFGGGYAHSNVVESEPATFSYEAWFKTNTSNGGLIAGLGNLATGASSGYDRQLWMASSGKIVFHVFAAGPSVYYVVSPTPLSDNSWHYAVVTASNANGLKLYIDGTFVNAQALPAGALVTESGYVRIAYDNMANGFFATPSNSFAGSLDEIAIYPAELTQAQITAHYNKGKGN